MALQGRGVTAKIGPCARAFYQAHPQNESLLENHNSRESRSVKPIDQACQCDRYTSPVKCNLTQLIRMRIHSELSETGSPGQCLDPKRRHVFVRYVMSLAERGCCARVTCSGFGGDEESTIAEGPVCRVYSSRLVERVMEGRKEHNGVELIMELHLFVIARNEFGAPACIENGVLFREADRVFREILSDCIVTGLGEEGCQPSRAATAFEHTRRRLGQKSENRTGLD